jgi:hypothetical protein
MRGGRWVTSGIYQDKSDALRDARGTMRKRYVAVRVVEEIFDPARDRFVTRTIYRDSDQPAPVAVAGGSTAILGVFDEGAARAFPSTAFALLGVPVMLAVAIGTLFLFGLV